jgi:hypothetical protein
VDRIDFMRLQISVMFVISFLGGMVHMALHSVFGEWKFFDWAENLQSALQAEGATMSSVADAAELPELGMEMMSQGMLYVFVVWFAVMILPAIIPLLTEGRRWRWVTAILGLVMTIMGIFDSISHMTMPGQFPLGLSGLIIGSIPGIAAVFLTLNWARVS